MDRINFTATHNHLHIYYSLQINFLPLIFLLWQLKNYNHDVSKQKEMSINNMIENNYYAFWHLKTSFSVYIFYRSNIKFN